MRELIRSQKWPDLWPQDCSAALQNLLLAARAEGLGTVWTGVYPFEERMAGCRGIMGTQYLRCPFFPGHLGYCVPL